MVRIILLAPYAMLFGFEFVEYEQGRSLVIHFGVISLEFASFYEDI